jgi:Asp-tRNA(Asn)/Glu-tRNA(Gln) amidotransferase A subunit family amidase
MSLNSIQEIREHLIKGSFTSVDLVNVYGNLCQTIGRELNLSTKEMFEEAMEEAKIKDSEREEALRQGKVDELPPFHGIPMSIKDNVRALGLLYRLRLKARQLL